MNAMLDDMNLASILRKRGGHRAVDSSTENGDGVNVGKHRVQEVVLLPAQAGRRLGALEVKGMKGHHLRYVQTFEHINELNPVWPDTEFVLEPENMVFMWPKPFQDRTGREIIATGYAIPNWAGERGWVIVKGRSVAL